MPSHLVRVVLFENLLLLHTCALSPKLLPLHHLIPTLHLFHIPLILSAADICTEVPEITRIWCRPKTRGSYLFLLNRYFGFFGGVTVTVLNFCAMPRET